MPQLLDNIVVVERVAPAGFEMIPETQNFCHLCEDGQLGAEAIELTHHAPRRFDHELHGRTTAVAMDLVIEAEDQANRHYLSRKQARWRKGLYQSCFDDISIQSAVLRLATLRHSFKAPFGWEHDAVGLPIARVRRAAADAPNNRQDDALFGSRPALC